MNFSLPRGLVRYSVSDRSSINQNDFTELSSNFVDKTLFPVMNCKFHEIHVVNLRVSLKSNLNSLRAPSFSKASSSSSRSFKCALRESGCRIGYEPTKIS